jgi:hypothetical protein
VGSGTGGKRALLYGDSPAITSPLFRFPSFVSPVLFQRTHQTPGIPVMLDETGILRYMAEHEA